MLGRQQELQLMGGSKALDNKVGRLFSIEAIHEEVSKRDLPLMDTAMITNTFFASGKLLLLTPLPIST